MAGSRFTVWMFLLENGGLPLDLTPIPGPAASGYRHPDVVPPALIEDVLEIRPLPAPPVREIANPYRFRRQT